jgi:ribosome maturation factor RimP
MQDDLANLTEDVRARVAELGFELVDLRRGGTARRARLQVRIDRPEATPGHGITVDDCTHVSRALERWLDGAGLLGSNYILDVNVRLRGRGRRRATIVRVLPDAEAVVLRVVGEEAEVTVPLDEARDATLVVDWNKDKGEK